MFYHYALPAWGIYVSAGQHGKIDAFLRPAHVGFVKRLLPLMICLLTLLKHSSGIQPLFTLTSSVLPEKKIVNYTLRYNFNADLICTNVPSLIGVCLTCDIAVLCFVCCFIFMHVCCINF